MTSRTIRFEALDAMRGLCAVMVVLFHLPTDSHVRDLPLVQHAYLFVDFFFVLSGFVMAHSYGGRIGDLRDAGRFLGRRLGRVWPLHAAVLAAFVLLELARLAFAFDPVEPFADDRPPVAILTNILLIQGLHLHDSLTWNGPAWSISVELAAYAVFAALLLAAPKRFALVAIPLAVGCALLVVTQAERWMNTTHDWGWARALYGFLVGCLVHRLWRLAPPPARLAAPLQILSLVVVLLFVWFAVGPWTVLAPLPFALAVWALSDDGTRLGRALSTPAPSALGRWSYSIYMNHMLVIIPTMIVARKLPGVVDGRRIDVGPTWANDLITLGVVLAIVALSALTFRFIEGPGRDLANRWVDRLSPPRTTRPAPSPTDPGSGTAARPETRRSAAG